MDKNVEHIYRFLVEAHSEFDEAKRIAAEYPMPERTAIRNNADRRLTLVRKEFLDEFGDACFHAADALVWHRKCTAQGATEKVAAAV